MNIVITAVRVVSLLYLCLLSALSRAELPGPVVVKVGDPLRITVTATGSGTLHYEWMHNQAAFSTRRFDNDSPTLDLGAAEMDERGGYSVFVRDDTGTRLESYAIVSVYEDADPALVEALDAPALEWKVRDGVFQSTTDFTADGQDALVLNPGHYWFSQPALTTTVQGPGSLTFKAATDRPYPSRARFSLVDATGSAIVDESLDTRGEWQTYTYVVPAGKHELHWTSGSTDPRAPLATAFIDQVFYQPDTSGQVLDDRMEKGPVPLYAMQIIDPPGTVIDELQSGKTGLAFNDAGTIAGRYSAGNSAFGSNIPVFSQVDGVTYTATRLNGADIVWSSTPVMNEHSEIACIHRLSNGTYRLVVWDRFLSTPLFQAPLPELFLGQLAGITNERTIAGSYGTPLNGTIAFTWQPGIGYRNLRTLTDFRVVALNGMTSRGMPWGSVVKPGDSLSRAAYWDTNNDMHLIDTGTDDAASMADGRAVQGQNLIVGSFYTTGSTGNRYRAPFLWRSGDLINLGVLNPSADYIDGAAMALNDQGDVVGNSNGPFDHQRGFLWGPTRAHPEGELIDLGLPAGFDINRPHFNTTNDINNRIQIVGTASNFETRFASLWQNYQLRDLNAFRQVPTAWHLDDAFEINNRGQIVVRASRALSGGGFAQKYFLLIPDASAGGETLLIADGGFENGGTAWTNWGDSAVLPGVGVVGSHALQIRSQGRGQVIRGVQPGHTYFLQAHTRRDTVDPTGTVGVALSDSRYRLLETKRFKVETMTYRNNGVHFTVPADATRVEVWMWKSGGEGAFYVDNLTLTEEANAVDNPGFEITLAPWIQRLGENRVAADGERDAVLEIMESAGAWSWLDQAVTLAPGKRYKLIAWGKSSGTLTVGVKGQRLPRTELHFAADHWQKKELVLTVPENEVWNQVFVNGSQGLVDDVYLLEM